MDFEWESESYCVEPHEIVTEDGYILSLLRLVEKCQLSDSSKQKQIENFDTSRESRKTPVLLVHGFLSSSIQYFINESPEKCLPHFLADKGYDCWLLNLRGTKHSKKHSTLKTNSKKYWDFGAHEMGYYDLPATINYILETTGNKSLYYVGHSMGCTVFFMMATSKPEFCSKVKAMVALSPAAYGKHTNKFIRSSATLAAPLGKTRVFLRAEVSPKSCYQMTKSTCLPCFSTEKLSLYFYNKMNSFAGISYAEECSKELKIRLAKEYPASTSGRTMCHGMQVIKAGRFQYYDFGRSKNSKVYGQPTPPLYDISAITVPIALFHSVGDRLVSVKDGQTLAKQIKVLVSDLTVSDPKFSHLSYMTREKAVGLVYEPIVDIFKKYT